ncbi:energy transducer TonB [Alteromonas macleodii]|uniref:energy transducer TonB n=1 Tax=Alteromonas macleodii TaxID=28108 RepID=UPI00313E34B3
MIEFLLAANLVTYLNNPKYEVESCSVTPFELVTVTDPMWPTDTFELEGEVNLRAYVDSAGTVISSDIVTSTPLRIFDRAAKRALAKWKFNKSEANERCFNVKFKFELSD